MAMKSLKISVERLLEQEVDEINREGEEKYIKPFDLSEELTYLAGKIDFFEGIEGHDSGNTLEDDDDVEADKKDENLKEKEDDSKQDNDWPWSSVHSKLRLALSEMCVMLDVLQTLNKKRYLILDPIQQSPEQEKQTVQMLEKRKYLAKVGTEIGKGAAGLGVKSIKPGTIVIIDGDKPQKEAEYYTQLMEVRQFWRVKKSGNQITGDLSYRSSGSRFWHPGLFDVKAEHEEINGEENTDKKTLSISISPDLTKTSEIVVQVIDRNSQSPSNSMSTTIQLECNFVNAWEKEMSQAQQHLFNKEIFSQLSNDAFQGSFLGIEVLNSQIKCKILDNAEVIISHNVDSLVPLTKTSVPLTKTSVPLTKTSVPLTKTSENCDLDNANDLTLLLSALLYQQHRNVSKFSTPYPATSNYYGIQSKSSSLINLLQRKPNQFGQSILNEFIKQAEHKIWIKRVNSFLYKQSYAFLEPTVSFHWNVLKSRLKSIVMVTLSTVVIHKRRSSSFMLSVDEDGFHIYGKNVATIDLPFDMGGVSIILQNQIYKHLQSVIGVLCKQHGWSLLTSTTGTNMLSPGQFLEAPLILTSFRDNRTIYLYIGDMQNVKVEVSKDDTAEERDQSFLDAGFLSLNKSRINLPWEVLPGENFVDKCQALMLFS